MTMTTMGLQFYLYYLHVLILTLHFYCNHDSKALSSTVSSVYVIVEVIKQANELADSDFFFFQYTEIWIITKWL